MTHFISRDSGFHRGILQKSVDAVVPPQLVGQQRKNVSSGGSVREWWRWRWLVCVCVDGRGTVQRETNKRRREQTIDEKTREATQDRTKSKSNLKRWIQMQMQM